MDNSTKIDEFFSAERKFLNKHVDLRKVLEMEGWKPMPSRFKGISKFQFKGGIVDVTFHKGADAYQWNDDLNRSGNSIDLLKDEREMDPKKRFLDALNKLRAYSGKLIPEATREFYDKCYDELKMLNLPVEPRTAVDPYLRYEAHFLKSEVSIYKLAHEMGYRPFETKGRKIYFQKGEITVSFAKSEGNGYYLWYEPELKKGGTIVEFLAFERNSSKESAYEDLKLAALQLVLPEKQQEFLLKAYEIKPEPVSETALRSMMEASPLASDYQLTDGKGHLVQIRDLQEGYSRIPKLMVAVWDSDQVLLDIVPRHFRIPELNPAFLKVKSELGVEVAREVTRIALLSLAAQKIPSGILTSALRYETLKPAVTKILDAIKGIKQELGQGTEISKIKIIKDFVETEASGKHISSDLPENEKSQGLSI